MYFVRSNCVGARAPSGHTHPVCICLLRKSKMVFFINIYGRATDPPDKDKGNQNDKNRYGHTSNFTAKTLPKLVSQSIGCSVLRLTWGCLDVLDKLSTTRLSNDLSPRHRHPSTQAAKQTIESSPGQKWSNVANIWTSGVLHLIRNMFCQLQPPVENNCYWFRRIRNNIGIPNLIKLAFCIGYI